MGVEREILPNTAVTVDFIRSYGRDQTNRLDINEPRVLANGTFGRPGVAIFDPDGTRTGARGDGPPVVVVEERARRVLEHANPIGDRRSSDFLRSVVADDPRSMQIGFRVTF